MPKFRALRFAENIDPSQSEEHIGLVLHVSSRFPLIDIRDGSIRVEAAVGAVRLSLRSGAQGCNPHVLIRRPGGRLEARGSGSVCVDSSAA